MFEDVAVEELSGVLAAHDFDASDNDLGADEIDGIRAYDLVIRAAQASQARLIGALDTKRAEKMTLGRGDHSLSVIGEVSMARNPPARSAWGKMPGSGATDHIHTFAEGGTTKAANVQGLCTRSHTFKHLPGWIVRADDSAISWRTPTGHSYRSAPPSLIPGIGRTPGRLRQ